MVAEGVKTTCSAKELGKRYSVEMPITNEVWDVLFKGKSPMSALESLMTRKPKDEDA